MSTPGKTKNPNAAAMLEGIFGSDLLAKLTGTMITGEEVEFHDGHKIILPRDMTYEEAYAILERLQQEAETATAFNRTFRYRPDDGAYATLQVIKNLYGMLLGKETWFSPATSRTVAIGVNENIQVPWGNLEIPLLPGLQITLCDQHADRDWGKIFEIHAMGPKKYEKEMEKIFAAIDEYLTNHSIYRGKAIQGADDPQFLDLTNFDPSKIVFSDEATSILEGLIHTPIRFTASMREEGIPLKRSALLEGPYGTGKTSEGQILAGIAVENGWTFISARPGRDKVEDVLRTARLYEPAVVFIEDIDGSTNSGEDDEVTKMLDAFDGITAKGGELFIVMTTNHVGKIHKGMLRPGRLDAVVHIGVLDRGGVERMIKAVVDPLKLDGNVDYDAVFESMHGFYPAFVKEAVNRARTYAIKRLNGATDYLIETEDLVDAAISLHSQLKQLEDAGEGVRKANVDSALRGLVEETLLGADVVDPSRGLAQPIVVREEA